ncbi:MAG: tRNA lysidine(34) synthetase TilS [Lutibacter sp.]|uniref:tRNA lysidine(34) synthetase TilS n=1 Tax=Lutibacter sp. TaxID=1925666 RepID=UPI00299E8614|nr:tRNA lysidine(34) synthetase TilS [Lutibacter sp.]MDX1829400.1 tRNA lysidine(34) synthetase TilS [Lutibacter sp.]
MLAKLQQHINTNLPFLMDKKLLITISGGIDSVVLTYLLHKLKLNISLAHCNFKLRGKDSFKDADFVKDISESLNIPFFTIEFETLKYAEENKISIQMAARDLRYNWFQKISTEQNFDYILTAHHLDDVLETFLINLTRGTGLNGLTGIPEINGNIVRPLLPFSRNDILIYASKNKLKWREDKSNSSIKYVRNKIRHKVIPVLKELNPNLLNSFENTLNNLRGSQQINQDHIKNILEKVSEQHENELIFNIKKIKQLNNPKIYLYELLKNYGFTEFEDVEALLTAQSGKQVFSKTHRLLKDRNVLILTEIEKNDDLLNFEISENTPKIEKPIPLKFETITIPFDTKNYQNKILEEVLFDDKNTVSLDYDKITFPLIIRKWQKGDYFFPIGLNGKKKISKFFKDEKLAITAKENIWLLLSNNQIIWVIGHRLDDRFKVTKTTNKILKITC